MPATPTTTTTKQNVCNYNLYIKIKPFFPSNHHDRNKNAIPIHSFTIWRAMPNKVDIIDNFVKTKMRKIMQQHTHTQFYAKQELFFAFRFI